MRILMLLSNSFTRDPRVYNETASLVAAGHDVTVLAWDRDSEAPLHEVTATGVTVHRLRHDGIMRPLRFDLLRLPILWRRMAKAGLRLHQASPFQAIHAHDLDTLPAGARIKAATGLPLVYDSHEIFPHVIARDLPRPVAAWFGRLERRMGPMVDHAIVVNDKVAEHARRAFGDRVPLHLVMNAKPVTDRLFMPPADRETGASLRVLYIGTLNEARFLLGAVEALAGLDGVELVVAGVGKPGYVQKLAAACEASANARFLGPVPHDQVVPMTEAAHVVLCLTDPTDANNRIATANKQFEAMAAGRPILCSKGTYPGDFTVEHELGLAVPHTKEGVHDGVVVLRDNPKLVEQIGRHAYRLAQQRFNWNAQATRLLALYDALASGPDA